MQGFYPLPPGFAPVCLFVLVIEVTTFPAEVLFADRLDDGQTKWTERWRNLYKSFSIRVVSSSQLSSGQDVQLDSERNRSTGQ